MDTTDITYPFFEANQVLSNGHLNELFDYLDEQQRLTRANLIGVGIACGLEVSRIGPNTVGLSKGCGVTTTGYLITEREDVDLVAYRAYELPAQNRYAPFVDPATTQAYQLWELCPDDTPGTQPLASTGAPSLDDKAVVLFLELQKEGLRNCSPNSCDDRGAEVTATVRPLLIKTTDLDKVIAAAGTLPGGLSTDFGTEATERLKLRDLRMPRVDVPSTGLMSSASILEAFRAPFGSVGLVANAAAALDDLYLAFKPLVLDLYPTNPFTGFTGKFGFLDAGPTTTSQLRFMQYYWDLFDDLLAAYDELRWNGVDLMCACCPPDGLFPRHLMAGVLDPSRYADPRTYRHQFVPSPAVGDCSDRTRVVRTLFRRLVTMIASFTDTPPLAGEVVVGHDPQIRVTPSRWGDVPLSSKAIPYYYRHDTTSPLLYEVWNPAKTARNRANQNLGYRATEYQPAAPQFVSTPLRFDLEPNNFLRIEGHLGKDVRNVVESLLRLKESHRLPIEVIALRSGAFNEDVEIDLSKEQCRFEDLETLYKALRGELACSLVKQVEYFYDLPDPTAPDAPPQGRLPLLEEWAPDYEVKPNTLGRRIELLREQSDFRVSYVLHQPHLATYVAHLVNTMSGLAATTGPDLGDLDVAAFKERSAELAEFAKWINENRGDIVEDQPGLPGRLDDLVFKCRLDPFEALEAEYKRRILDVKQAQFLGHFLQKHPGIQHKAGVPLGGTFVVVCHDANTEGNAAAGLVDGTVLADFFLPYLCCSDCPPIHYTLPSVQLRVEAHAACTNADGFADVTVVTTGAVGSVSVQADGGPFTQLTGPLSLAVGDHTLVVRDDTGAQSAPLEITIRPQLTITDPQTHPGPPGTYHVEFVVEGGTEPYVADSGSFIAAKYTSAQVKIGQALTVVVQDAAGCTVSGTFDSPEDPCGLPCGGEAVRFGYRFWVPEPRDRLPLTVERLVVRYFLVDGPDGQVDLTDKVQDAIGHDETRDSRPIATADFPRVVERWLERVNKLIAEAVGSEDWLRLEYEAAGKATTGTLFVDRLRCVEIKFELEVAYAQQKIRHDLTLIYATDGTFIVQPDARPIHVPLFDGSTSDKCHPDDEPEPLCEGVDLDLQIRHHGKYPDVLLVAEASDPHLPVAYLWEVEGATPSLAAGPEVKPTFESAEPVEKTVRLTAFTERGCRVDVQRDIDLRKPDDDG